MELRCVEETDSSSHVKNGWQVARQCGSNHEKLVVAAAIALHNPVGLLLPCYERVRGDWFAKAFREGSMAVPPEELD